MPSRGCGVSGRVTSVGYLQFSKHFFQQRSGLGGRIFPDFRLFLCQLVEEAVERFADYVFVEIEFAGEHASARGLLDELVVELNHSDTLHGLMDDGSECGGEVGGAGALEIIGGGGVVAGEDVAGIVESHFSEGRDKDLFGLRRGLLGGAVHADFEIIDGLAHAESAHFFANAFESGREKDFDGFVLEETIGLADGGDSAAGADLKRLLEAGDDFVVAESGDIALLESDGGDAEREEKEQIAHA